MNIWKERKVGLSRQNTAIAESKGRSSEKGSEPDMEGGPDEKRKRQKKSTTGLNL